ncbi:hypothetical protein B0H63DRAFT_536003 [Podospora didyma]|uniref:Zn(2)-C6 fungal-type domain-containing protein n=1 Tax=Podospora didyma TaxID=330526 RepID=A0AAE0K0R6_9PEZI|nr:hypothetical protein B0H63DRAFT_536003 [Podospora didyma]
MMVYNGPSKGCKTCRIRRVKCDQARPGCVNCCRRNELCPGYSDVFEKMHRDETFRVLKRNSQRKAQASPTADDASLRIASTVLPGLEFTALGFFFHHYGGVNANRDIQATCSFFEFLPAMYARASVSSPLSIAITAFAINVANLHSFRRSNATAACRLYVDAVAGTKIAIADPRRSKSDELLMATLVLEAYESVNASFQRRQKSHAHALGSIALLRHRGALANRNELSRRMTIAVGSRFIRDAVDGMANIITVRRLWEDAGVTKSHSPAIRADILALELAQLECLQRSLSISPSGSALDAVVEADPYLSILSKASDLASRCMQWRVTLPCKWRFSPMPIYELAPSIQTAGMYSSPTSTNPHCDIYNNLSVANTLNRHRITELRNLALIRTSLAAVSTQLDCYERLSPLESGRRAQFLVDEICASVPFFAGDVTGSTILHAKDGIQVPYISPPASSPASTETLVAFPEDNAGYARQVVTSGLWMIHDTLVAALNIVAENGALGAVLRKGQVLWIRGQISRLQAVFRMGR